MIKYAKIINEETRECEVGIGTNVEFYKSIGMTEIDVEQASDGSWYLAGSVPEIPEPVPTRSQMHELRKQAYAETTDRLSLERMRLQAIGQWNADKELEYQAKMAEMSEEIKAKYPFSKKETPSTESSSVSEDIITE